MKTFEEITKDFVLRGISTDVPRFYDHPNFIAAELENPNYLLNSAFYVASQPYSEQYLAQAETIIRKVSRLLYEHLKKSKQQRVCIDISGILARILEKHGVWCAQIGGSCKIEFPPSFHQEALKFDVGRELTAGHSWLFAPPFNIVDITISEQGQSTKIKKYLPKLILKKGGSNSTVEIEDIIDPSILFSIQNSGIPRNRILQTLGLENMEAVQRFFPVKVVETSKGVRFKFCPVKILASIEPLERLNAMKFKGKTAHELYKKHFEKNIGFIGV